MKIIGYQQVRVNSLLDGYLTGRVAAEGAQNA